jgi:hypothetical protein
MPTFAGFLSFVRNVMGITDAVLPDSSMALVYAYNVALALVNQGLLGAGSWNGGQYSLYQVAVYNLGGDNLINFAPDLPNAPQYQNGLPYFQYQRSVYGVNAFAAGLVESSSTESTSTSVAVSISLQNLTFADIQNSKTPWGRQYLGIAQAFGPVVFGMT